MYYISKISFLTLFLVGIVTSCNKEDKPTPDPPAPNPFGTMTDSRDGNIYTTVKIGQQTWMAENLRYLPQVHLQADYVGAFTEPRYFVYGYNGNDVNAAKQHINYSTYGVLYNWAAFMQGAPDSDLNPSGVQGICPNGWHVPSHAEWEQLVSYLIDNTYNYDGTTVDNKIAKSVASKTLWAPSSEVGTPGNNPSQNNTSGLNILPAGINSFPDYHDMGQTSEFWTSTKSSDGFGPGRKLNYDWELFYQNTSHSNHVAGKSCRCVKN